MKLKGKIYKRLFSDDDTVDFYADNTPIAKLMLGSKEISKDVYRIVPSENAIESFPEIIISLRGIFKKKYLIQALGSETTWVYKSKKWYDFITGKSLLITHEDSYEIVESNENLQIYKQTEWIGTVKKVYETVFDGGEYDASFESKDNLRLFLVIASIYAIKIEVIQYRNSN